VDAAARKLLAEVVLQIENEPLEESARRIVERLSPGELAKLVADWLESQTAIWALYAGWVHDPPGPEGRGPGHRLEQRLTLAPG
jgi:hypothetical protein